MDSRSRSQDKIRELDSLKSRDHDCSHAGSSKDSQKSALKERQQSLIKRESSLPAIGRSTGGGEGPSVAEVATSFPARLLGAIGERRAKEVLGFLNEERRRSKRVKVL